MQETDLIEDIFPFQYYLLPDFFMLQLLFFPADLFLFNSVLLLPPTQASLTLPPTWTTCISWHCASATVFTRLSAGYLCSNWDLVWLCCWLGLTTFICCASSLLGMATHTHISTSITGSDVWTLVLLFACFCSFFSNLNTQTQQYSTGHIKDSFCCSVFS